jgi:type IV pilus assembly protein PilN
MIKINLVAEAPVAAAKKPKKAEVSLGSRQGEVILLVTLMLFLAVTAGLWYKLESERKRLAQEQQEKKRERDSLQQYIDRAEELEKQREKLRRKIDVINQLKQNQRGPVRIMDEISRALPDLVWLTKLNLKGTSVRIEGMAMDENAVANYISNLDASPFFQEPSLGGISASQNETFSFSLDCVFTYAPVEIESAGEGE